MIHCLHGAVGSHRDWDPLTTDLATPVHPVDLWRFFDHACPSLAEVGEMIADQAAGGDFLLGYSMGGRLALHALLAAPGKWRAAVIISAHPGLRDGQAARRRSDQTWAGHVQRDWDSFLSAWNGQGILAGSLHGLQQAPASAQDAVAQSFQYWSLGSQRDLRPLFPGIPCPVLWLTGEKDPKFTALAAEAVPLLPQGRHQALPGCGHRLPWEKPDLFRNAVEKFFLSTRNHPNQSS